MVCTIFLLQMYQRKLEENVREALANVRERENGRKCTRKPCKCMRKNGNICEKPFQMYEKNQRNCTRNWVPELAALGLPASARLFVAALLFSAKKWWEWEFQQHSQTSRLVVPLLYKIQSTTNWRETLPGFRASCVKSRKFFSHTNEIRMRIRMFKPGDLCYICTKR